VLKTVANSQKPTYLRSGTTS